MNTLLSGLIPLLKPFVKELLDAVVFPAILALEAKLPNPPVESAVVAIQAAVDSYIDGLLA